MGKKLLAVFDQDLKVGVRDSLMCEIAKAILKECDDLNATEAASSSGKYHPVADLGKEGLVRHSRLVAELACIMARSIPAYDEDINHDIIFLSGLLHDLCKYQPAQEGEEGYPNQGDIHTNFDHPKKMQELVLRVSNDYIDNMTGVEESKILLRNSWARIAANIATHMSRWNVNEKYAPGVVLDTPQSLEQYIIVFADLVSANSELPGIMKQMEEEAVAYIVGRKK